MRRCLNCDEDKPSDEFQGTWCLECVHLYWARLQLRRMWKAAPA